MRKTITLVLLAALFASPALAQERQAQGGVDHAAQAYGASEWPAAEAPRAGVDPSSIAAAGFERLALRVDPRNGEAQLTFGSETAKGPAARVSLQVHKDGKAARAALLMRLATTQVRLPREEGLGALTYGGRRDGRLEFAVGAIGNVSFAIRGVGQTDVEPLAAAVARTIAGAAALKPAQTAPTPRVLACEADAIVVGQPARLRLDFDPGAAQAAHVAFVCSEGAGVMQTKAGYELYTSKPGLVTIQVFACSRELRVAVFTAQLEAVAR